MRINGQLVKWLPVGEGSFNKTYISKDVFEYIINGINYKQRWILKNPKKDRVDDLNEEMNDSKRAVRLWNELNSKTPAIELPELGGWLAPYFGDTAAKDIEIAKKQLDLYREHRRIVVDGCGKKNFLSFNGEIIIVDVDQALHSDSPTSERILNEIVELGKKNSVCEKYWDDFSEHHNMPRSVQMIKTLLYLESQLPAIKILDKYIKADVIEKLHDYQIFNKIITTRVLESLLKPAKDAYQTENISTLVQRHGFFSPRAMPHKATKVIKPTEIIAPIQENESNCILQ